MSPVSTEITTFFRCVVVVTSLNRDSVPLADIQSAQIIVGTSCAGTGLDISGLGHIIVVGLPFSVEELLQWAGRCRSDGTVSVFVPSFQMNANSELASKNEELIVNICVLVLTQLQLYVTRVIRFIASRNYE